MGCIQVCGICGRPATVTYCGENASIHVSCGACGEYRLTEESADAVHKLSASDRVKLSAFTRGMSIHKSPVALSETTTEGAITLTEAVDSFPRSVMERTDKALLNIVKVSRYTGAQIELTDKDYPLLYCDSSECDALNYMKDILTQLGYLTPGTGWPRVTARGLQKAYELEQAGNIKSRQVFVAMWFDGSMREAYEGAIKPAVLKAGYEPLRIDGKEHNGKIDDQIIAEVRRSRFLISDFTGHRGGVYFEAGFAMGLGIPVIWTCRHDHIDRAHFDTRQYNHIVWESTQDLQERLYQRIRATIV